MKEIIEVLNKARNKELYSTMHYLRDARVMRQMGNHPLSNQMKKIAIEEMEHAEILAWRIMELGGIPIEDVTTEGGPVFNIKYIFEKNAKIENKALTDYSVYFTLAESKEDEVTANIFLELMESERKHLSFFEKISNLIEEDEQKKQYAKEVNSYNTNGTGEESNEHGEGTELSATEIAIGRLL